MATKYLTELLAEKKISKLELCSANRNKLLTLPRTTRKTFASRAFSIHGPSLWNKLRDHIRTSANYSTFKREHRNTFIQISIQLSQSTIPKKSFFCEAHFIMQYNSKVHYTKFEILLTPGDTPSQKHHSAPRAIPEALACKGP